MHASVWCFGSPAGRPAWPCGVRHLFVNLCGVCARWGFGPFAAALVAQPWRLWGDLRSTDHVRLLAPYPSPCRLSDSEQRCPCVSPHHFPSVQWMASCPGSRSCPPRLEHPLPSALTSSTGSPCPPACHLPSCLAVSSAPRPHPTGPAATSALQSSSPHPFSFLPSFRFWSVGGFFHGRGRCLWGSDKNTGNVCAAASWGSVHGGLGVQI